MNNQKGFSPIIITLIILALAGIGGASYYLVNEQPSEPTACGTETKVCPDGSLVGRTGPDCEFAACPEIVDETTTNLKTYTNNKYNYQISYPGNKYTIENIISDPRKEMTDESVTLYDIKSVQETKECECGEYRAISINIYPNLQELSLEDYIEENIRPKYSNYFINEETSLNGIPARKVGTERDQFYILKKGNIIVSIGGFLDMDVINTFKFTDTTQSQNNNALFVYLTDQKYQGNLGERSGADAKCSIPAGLSCKSGSNHALITVDNNDSIINLARNYNLDLNAPIYWYNRDNQSIVSLANNWSEIINKDILYDQKEGTGKGEWSGDFPWTGGKGDNANEGDYTCNKWTSNEGDKTTSAGLHGIIGGTDKTSWLASDGWAGISFAETCDNERYLRCICEKESNAEKFLTIISPDGSNDWIIGKNYEVKWDSKGISNVDIYFGWKDEATGSISPIATNLPVADGKYLVTVPSYLWPYDSYKICIYESKNKTSTLDNSNYLSSCTDENLNIKLENKNPSIKITSPQDEAYLKKNNTYRISWEAKDINNVNIYLTCGRYEAPSGCDHFQYIAKSIPALNGEYNFTTNEIYQGLNYYKLVVEDGDTLPQGRPISEQNTWSSYLPVNDSINFRLID